MIFALVVPLLYRRVHPLDEEEEVEFDDEPWENPQRVWADEEQ